jgi:DNA repair exonuclease SbcCD nuclease subunit
MKIAIISDMHIGYERFRSDAYAQASEALVSASKVSDAIIIPGDIFDFRHPKPDVIAEAMGLFRELPVENLSARVVEYDGLRKTYTKLPIIAIPGTHERRADGDTDPVDLLTLAGLVVNVNQGRAIIEKDGERVAIYGVGGVAEERFRETLNRLNPTPLDGLFNIFMFHQSVYELLPFSNDFVRIEELPKGFDLYVDGHIHNKVEMKCHGKDFLIPGSTVLTQLKDAEQEGKGFFVYDTGRFTHSFEEIKSRKFFNVKLKIDGKEPNEINETMENEIVRIKDLEKNPIIRFELSGDLKQGFKNIDIESRPHKDDKEIIVEVSKSRLNNGAQKDVEVQEGISNNISIRDFGMSVFISKLKDSGYALSDPISLFDILSSEDKKENVLRKAVDSVLD